MHRPNKTQPRRPPGGKDGGQFTAAPAADPAPGAADGLTLVSNRDGPFYPDDDGYHIVMGCDPRTEELYDPDSGDSLPSDLRRGLTERIETWVIETMDVDALPFEITLEKQEYDEERGLDVYVIRDPGADSATPPYFKIGLQYETYLHEDDED